MAGVISADPVTEATEAGATAVAIPESGGTAADGTENSWAVDRYMLPRIALVFISIASLSGVYLTMATHGGSPGLALVRWLHLMSLGILAGGMMWRGFFIEAPEDAEERREVARFVEAQMERFRKIGLAALAVALGSSVHLALMARWAQSAADVIWLGAATLTLIVALAGTAVLLRPLPQVRTAFVNAGPRMACGALVLALALTAAVDAHLTFPGNGTALALRPLHLVAFGLWVGGAVWNIFIAVPAARNTLSLSVVIVGAGALEWFRRVVRVILPTLILTGLAQAFPYTGFSMAALTGNLFGRLILFKLSLVVGLVVIFITCPLWRACSPIRGMCDLEDLRRANTPDPSVRLDNRGKACAGFVAVRRALEALQPGAVLELLSTDTFSWWELPAWLEVNGYVLIEREKGWWWLRRSYRYLVRKTV